MKIKKLKSGIRWKKRKIKSSNSKNLRKKCKKEGFKIK